ncbi:MAG TPA: GMC family oxidoreductase [Chthonomonadaceae bacterium]|nr:GMC family oxidoreductase [Chthonomonadaceae bacterium]
MKSYDVIVVGTGAAGGIVAGVLAEAGKHVLLLERGRNLSFEEVGRDHLRNQRLSLYGHNAGPDIEGNPRVWVDPLGNAHHVRPHEGGYHNNAATVGGGTRVYGAQAWRFMAQDFRMASLYGVPEGSSLADWPLTYDDLEPYYERAEWEIGVAGSDEGHRFQAPRRKGYPMPPVPLTRSGAILERAARALGWNTAPVPLAINTVPYGGREACIQCKYCVGFACPTDAKNGSQNTLIPRALATGNCELVTEAMAERIETNAQGDVVGVSYLIERNGQAQRVTAQAKVVVVSAGAIESARLLLNSASSHHPRGLGNAFDQVGRNLQGHYYPGAFALMEETTQDGIGPGPSIATCQFNHGNPGVLGGGMLANDFIKLPIIFWRTTLPPDLPRWGAENKEFMRRYYTRYLQVMGPVQEIPNPQARVTVDPSVRDRWGLPVACLSGTTHPETVRTAQFMRERAEEWLRACGAGRIWSYPPSLGLSAGQHQAGTCRMGDDPRASVTDKWGRVHAHDNLYVVDASLHVTNGGFNPVLTIMALAFRSAEHIAATV